MSVEIFNCCRWKQQICRNIYIISFWLSLQYVEMHLVQNPAFRQKYEHLQDKMFYCDIVR